MQGNPPAAFSVRFRLGTSHRIHRREAPHRRPLLFPTTSTLSFGAVPSTFTPLCCGFCLASNFSCLWISWFGNKLSSIGKMDTTVRSIFRRSCSHLYKTTYNIVKLSALLAINSIITHLNPFLISS